MSNQWGYADEAGLFEPGHDFGGDESQVLEEGQYGVAAGDYGDKAVIYGSREAMLELGRRMVVGFADEPGQPAVTFDAEKFRAWLDTLTSQATTIRHTEPLGAAYQRLDGDGGWLAEAVLFLVHQDGWHTSTGWTYSDGVGPVKVWATAAAEGGPDGGLAGEVIVDGLPLSLGRVTERELVPVEHDTLPGYEAAEHILTALAERVNDVAARTRALRGVSVNFEPELTTLVKIWSPAGGPELKKAQSALLEKIRDFAAAGWVIDGDVELDSNER